MKTRRVLVAAMASALALGGLAAFTAGSASAAKPVLTGNLSCKSSGTTTISPGIVFSAANLPPPKFKDKGPKYTTTGTGSLCTGTTTGGPQPTGYTLTSKAKGLSRVLLQPASACGAPGRVAKTKVTFDTGAKLKASMLSETGNYAFNPVGQVSTPFPPCGSPSNVANAFAVAHGNERIETRSSGISGGKAFKGKLITTKSVTTETLIDQLAASLTPTGVAALHGDPLYSTLTIHP